MVIPNAKKNRIVEGVGETKIYLAVPAKKDNNYLTLKKFLSECYYVQRDNVFIVSGQTSRKKLVQIFK
jgi:uncharacterized protein YggU (UPF0235/DUF167 family)